jgi:hypothetical protein
MQLIGKGALTIYRIEGFFITYSSPTITSPWEGTKVNWAMEVMLGMVNETVNNSFNN